MFYDFVWSAKYVYEYTVDNPPRIQSINIQKCKSANYEAFLIVGYRSAKICH